MGTRKGKLFELASTFQKYQKNKVKDQPYKKIKDQPSIRMKDEPVRKNGESKKVDLKREVKGEHFDEGKSISLTYSFDSYPEEGGTSASTYTEGMSSWESDRSEAFYVEPFEAEEFVEAPYREVRPEPQDAEDARIENIVTSFSRRQEEHEDLQDDEEKLGDMEKKIDDMLGSDDDSKAMEATGDDSSGEAVKYFREALPESLSEETTTTTTNTARPTTYDVSDEEFARDIGAILQGQKVYDAEQKKAVGREATPTGVHHKTEKTETQAKAAKEDPLDAGKNEHKIFEKIAQSMAYANSYDLGAIALEEKFQLMDREIEKEEVTAVLKNPGAIEDAHVVEEAKNETVAMALDEKFDPKVPLDHLNGGRLVKVDELQKGDLILMSAMAGSGIISVPKNDECVGGVYLGNKKIMTRGDGDILAERSFDPDLQPKGVIAVLRHQNITGEKAAMITEQLSKLNTAPQTNWIKISIPAVAPHADVCNASPDKAKCNSFAGRIQLGTMGNDSFLCAESILTAFEKNQIPFVQPLTKDHNGSLKYFGHLKNKA